MEIILDTNIFVSALLKYSLTRKIIIESKQTFLFPEIIFSELKRNEGELVFKSV